MAQSRGEQNFKNHTRLDPAFHFFAIPVFFFNAVFTIVRAIRDPGIWNFWSIVVAIALVVALLLIRTYALKVQDRVIRLEERLRLQGYAAGLDEKQLIALRFAGDEEAPGLAERAARENLTPKQIKEAIRIWRPDHLRV